MPNPSAPASIYGRFPYGVSPYGWAGPSTGQGFTASTFTSQVRDVGASVGNIYLTWVLPNSGQFLLASTTSVLSLVRNGFSTPANVTDGTLIYSPNNSGLTGSFLDTSAQPGEPNYYSLFVLDNTGLWQRAGDTIAILPSAWGYGDRLYNLLPQVYRDFDYDLALGAGGSGPLYNFLQLLGFQLDYTRSLLEELLDMWDPYNVPGQFISYIAENLGLTYEPFLDMNITRNQLANVVHSYKIKGSVQGVQDQVNLVTGYQTRIQPGDNQIIDVNNSRFTFNTGLWIGSVGENLVTYDMSVTNLHVIDPGIPLNIGSNYYYPPGPDNNTVPSDITTEEGEISVDFGDTVLAIYYPSAPSTLSITSIGGNGSTPTDGGVPVVPNNSYTLSAYAWEAAIGGSTHTFELSISWYDMFGNVLSTNTSSAETETLHTWNRLTAGPFTSPSIAAWATFGVITTDNLKAFDPVYLGWFQFEDGNLFSRNQAAFAGGSSTGINPDGWTISNNLGTQYAPASVLPIPAGVISNFPDPATSYVLGVRWSTASVQATQMFMQTGTSVQSSTSVSVVGNATYTIKGAFYPAVYTHSVTMTAAWYDINGLLITDSSPGQGWIFPDQWTSLSYNVVAPANAVRIITLWTINGCPSVTAETIYANAFGVFYGPNQSYSVAPMDYQNPRDVQLHFFPERENLILNPDMQLDTTGGSVVANWGQSIDLPGNLTFSAVNGPAPAVGSKTLQVTSTSSATGWVYFTSPMTPVYFGGPMDLSFYCRNGAVSPTRGAIINCYDQGGVFISSTTLPSFTPSVTATWFLYDSTVLNGGVPFSAPSNTAYVTVQIGILNPAATTFNFCGFLLEHDSIAQPYFDADTPASGMLISDLFWSGLTGQSQSFYFPNSSFIQARLIDLLPSFLPVGATTSLYYTSP
jgi:phage tail-like protein